MSRWNDSENKIPSTRRISIFFLIRNKFSFQRTGEKKLCQGKMKDRSQITSGINFTRRRVRENRNTCRVREFFTRNVCVFSCFTADINEELLRFNAAIN